MLLSTSFTTYDRGYYLFYYVHYNVECIKMNLLILTKYIHSEKETSDHLQIEWNMIVKTVFLSFLKIEWKTVTTIVLHSI